MYGQKEPYRLLYKLGFLLGLASFFYLPVYLFMLYAFIVLFVLRFFNWREFVIPIVGFLTLYFFLAVWYFWFDQFNFVYTDYLRFFQSFDFIMFGFDILTIIILVIFVLLFLLSTLYLVKGKYYEKAISTREELKLSFIFMLISFIPIILYGGSMINSLIVLAIPLTIFISFYFCELKKIFLLNILTIFLILLMMINNYHLLDILNLE